MFVCCTYGYGLPVLFVNLLVVVSVLVAFDKSLVTYWYKP